MIKVTKQDHDIYLTCLLLFIYYSLIIIILHILSHQKDYLYSIYLTFKD